MIEKIGRRKWRFRCSCGYWSQWRSKKLAREDGARHITKPWQYPFPKSSIFDGQSISLIKLFNAETLKAYRTIEQQRIEYEVAKFREKLKEL